MSRRRLASYRQVQLNTAGPGQKVVMLYEAIVKSLKEVQDAFNDDSPSRFEIINNQIQHAQQIILELQLALDLENGGEIADNLNNLYGFWLSRLSDANANKINEPVIEVANMAEEMRETWQQACIEARKQGL